MSRYTKNTQLGVKELAQMNLQERIELEKELQKIENHETRLIVRLRQVHNMTYQQIGEVLQIDRTTVARKYRNLTKLDIRET